MNNEDDEGIRETIECVFNDFFSHNQDMLNDFCEVELSFNSTEVDDLN